VSDKHRLFVEERDLVFYIDDHEALRLSPEGAVYVWGEYCLTNKPIVAKMRHAFVHGKSPEDFELRNGNGLKIKGDN
jgi:hypothetical protein